MKHNNVFYLQLSREIFTEKYSNLSNNAKWLFVVLNELEQRYTGTHEDFFYRTNADLAKDCNFSLSTLKRAKAELLETDLIQSWQAHFIDNDSKTKSEKHFTCYRIKK